MGQLAAWPKLHIVENRFKIEREILKGRQLVRDYNRSNKTSTKNIEQIDLKSYYNSDIDSKQVDGTAQENIERTKLVNDLKTFNEGSDSSSDDNEPVEKLTNGASNNGISQKQAFVNKKNM